MPSKSEFLTGAILIVRIGSERESQLNRCQHDCRIWGVIER